MATNAAKRLAVAIRYAAEMPIERADEAGWRAPQELLSPQRRRRFLRFERHGHGEHQRVAEEERRRAGQRGDDQRGPVRADLQAADQPGRRVCGRGGDDDVGDTEDRAVDRGASGVVEHALAPHADGDDERRLERAEHRQRREVGAVDSDTVAPLGTSGSRTFVAASTTEVMSTARKSRGESKRARGLPPEDRAGGGGGGDDVGLEQPRQRREAFGAGAGGGADLPREQARRVQAWSWWSRRHCYRRGTAGFAQGPTLLCVPARAGGQQVEKRPQLARPRRSSCGCRAPRHNGGAGHDRPGVGRIRGWRAAAGRRGRRRRKNNGEDPGSSCVTSVRGSRARRSSAAGRPENQQRRRRLRRGRSRAAR